jgi:hypothetical protein
VGDGKVSKALADYVREAPAIPEIVLATHQVLPHIKLFANKSEWHILIDEALQAVRYQQHRIPKTHKLITDHLDVTRVNAIYGRVTVRDIALHEIALLPAAQADLWAGRVRASMRKTFTGVLETGKILRQARAELSHRQWLPMLTKAGLKPRTAQVWMAVACNRRFANASPDSLLPPCVTTLNEISRLPEDVYQGLLADGTINSTVSRTTIAAIIRRLAQEADERRILSLVPRARQVRNVGH